MPIALAHPMPAPAADAAPAAMLAAEALPAPPSYRSEGFAEDLIDGDGEAAERTAGRGAVGWLLAVPLTAAALGALASTLAAAA